MFLPHPSVLHQLYCCSERRRVDASRSLQCPGPCRQVKSATPIRVRSWSSNVASTCARCRRSPICIPVAHVEVYWQKQRRDICLQTSSHTVPTPITHMLDKEMSIPKAERASQFIHFYCLLSHIPTVSVCVPYYHFPSSLLAATYRVFASFDAEFPSTTYIIVLLKCTAPDLCTYIDWVKYFPTFVTTTPLQLNPLFWDGLCDFGRRPTHWLLVI